MVKELENALKQLNQLNEKEQREIAALIQDELLWDLTLSNSQNKLSQMAEEALLEYKSGKTQEGDWQ